MLSLLAVRVDSSVQVYRTAQVYLKRRKGKAKPWPKALGQKLTYKVAFRDAIKKGLGLLLGVSKPGPLTVKNWLSRGGHVVAVPWRQLPKIHGCTTLDQVRQTPGVREPRGRSWADDARLALIS